MTDALSCSVEVGVRFGDLDPMGHVNNAVYLTYLEQGRLDWFRRLTARTGADVSGGGAIVARIEIDYRRPVLLDAGPVRVAVGVRSVGRSSFLLGYTLTQGDAVAAEATSVVVAYDYAAGRTRPLGDALTEALHALLAPDAGQPA